MAPSTVPDAGEGLFATERIARGEIIGFYRGEVLTLREAMALQDRDYLMGGFGVNAHVDAQRAFAMPGRYVNDVFDAGRRNARFEKSRATRSAKVVALRSRCESTAPPTPPLPAELAILADDSLIMFWNFFTPRCDF